MEARTTEAAEAEAEAAEQNEQMPLLLLFNVLTRHTSGLTEAEIIERICLHFLSLLQALGLTKPFPLYDHFTMVLQYS